MSEIQGGSPGPSTDRHNDPVVDPTKNVLDLVEAERKRQDDLRDLDNKWRDHADKVRAEYDEKLREAEAKRIDAIRAVDVQATQQGRVEAETRARALEAQVAASAEAMRSQVAAAAAAAATSLANALDPVQKDIADLRRAQYEQQGQKQQVGEARAGASGVGQFVAIGIAAFATLLTTVAVLVSIYAATRPH